MKLLALWRHAGFAQVPASSVSNREKRGCLVGAPSLRDSFGPQVQTQLSPLRGIIEWPPFGRS